MNLMQPHAIFSVICIMLHGILVRFNRDTRTDEMVRQLDKGIESQIPSTAICGHCCRCPWQVIGGVSIFATNSTTIGDWSISCYRSTQSGGWLTHLHTICEYYTFDGESNEMNCLQDKACRLTSLIPFVSDQVLFPGLCDVWTTCDVIYSLCSCMTLLYTAMI